MMKTKQDNKELFDEALALREAMRALIHNQVVNKKRINSKLHSIKEEEKKTQSNQEASA
ncbi:hypothetical protein LG325_03305 [Marinobacter nauticus]